LFAKNGYHATGIQELSETVGLGRGALYHHIESKETLLFEISMSLHQQMLAKAQEIEDLGLSPEETIRRLARLLLESLAADRDGWTVSLRELSALGGDRWKEVVKIRDRYESIWERTFARGYEDGTLEQVSTTLRMGIIGWLNSTHRWIEADGATSPSEIADEYTDALLRGIGRKTK
jgi:AcrR family transcriptional regulator